MEQETDHIIALIFANVLLYAGYTKCKYLVWERRLHLPAVCDFQIDGERARRCLRRSRPSPPHKDGRCHLFYFQRRPSTTRHVGQRPTLIMPSLPLESRHSARALT